MRKCTFLAIAVLLIGLLSCSKTTTISEVFEDGSTETYEVNKKDSIRNGKYTFANADGSIQSIGNFINDLEDGEFIRYYENGVEELYNLDNDIGEQENIIDKYPQVAAAMSKTLTQEFAALPVLYPTADLQFNADSFQFKYQYYETTLMDKLEKQRKDFLRKDWQPNEDWWGSKVTID